MQRGGRTTIRYERHYIVDMQSNMALLKSQALGLLHGNWGSVWVMYIEAQ